MIVTIDGPAGAGKSSAARRLAQRLGFHFLDTGAMYRAVALAALRRGHDWNEPERLVELARSLKIEPIDSGIVLDGEDVTRDVRTQAVTSVTYHAANNPQVREHLVEVQRRFAEGSDIVTEGRDQGSLVFPHAECKIFLTATPEERARRRLADLQQRGESSTFDEILAEQTLRDQRDSTRAVGPLVKAVDAVELWTDGLNEDQVVDRLLEMVRDRLASVSVTSQRCST